MDNIATLQARVEEFHDRHGYAKNLLPASHDSGVGVRPEEIGLVKEIVEQLATLQALYQEDSEEIGYGSLAYRLMLAVEELTEHAYAAVEGNELEVADALGDRLYLLLGDAVHHGLPLQEIIAEVCDSNDTKQVRDEEEDPRMRDKGENYVEPDMQRAIDKGRNRESFEANLRRDLEDDLA